MIKTNEEKIIKIKLLSAFRFHTLTHIHTPKKSREEKIENPMEMKSILMKLRFE